MAVVDDIGSKRRFLKRDLKRITSSHAPADGGDAIFFHVGLRGKIFEGCVKIALGTVFRHAAHDFVGQFGCGCNLAAIKVNGQRDVALVGKL